MQRAARRFTTLRVGAFSSSAVRSSSGKRPRRHSLCARRTPLPALKPQCPRCGCCTGGSHAPSSIGFTSGTSEAPRRCMQPRRRAGLRSAPGCCSRAALWTVTGTTAVATQPCTLPPCTATRRPALRCWTCSARDTWPRPGPLERLLQRTPMAAPLCTLRPRVAMQRPAGRSASTGGRLHWRVPWTMAAGLHCTALQGPAMQMSASFSPKS
mmetsp:Transcript_15885/g.47754  ORF Transcript_15885/g.47754 Transcript_15885/m.47754 type:complete len:211 (+) Transcript_15885:388-1020(+)